MQTSYDERLWVEDPTAELQRGRLNPSDNAGMKRRLYPLIARVSRFSQITQLPVGTILTYTRTKMRPAVFPIEALILSGNVYIRQSLERDEVEILGQGK